MHKWKQNIAIAEASGWERGPKESSICGPSFLMAGQHWHKKTDKDNWQDCCPDFYSSLELMAEAEKCPALRAVGIVMGYIPNLVSVLQRDLKKHKLEFDYSEMLMACIFATSEQRAEAFLRTLGLWIENDPDDEKS